MNRAEADLVARRTVARYADAIDHKDLDAIAAIFAEDAELRRVGTVTTGRDAIAAFYGGFLPTVGHMRHFMTNTIAEPDGDLIRVGSRFSYLQVLDEGVRFGWGDYTDVIRPTFDEDGVFVEKEITVHHSQILPVEVGVALLPGALPPV
jgi:nuclear transport factor 2 (NTF2) superfamily protein|tara:strand:+ start:157 stop:603 length:447 start_codon:yes stop_codon:yes gene_type:complete